MEFAACRIEKGLTNAPIETVTKNATVAAYNKETIPKEIVAIMAKIKPEDSIRWVIDKSVT